MGKCFLHFLAFQGEPPKNGLPNAAEEVFNFASSDGITGFAEE